MKTVVVIYAFAVVLLVGEVAWLDHQINLLVDSSSAPDVTFGIDRENPPLRLPLTNLEKQGLKNED